MSNINRKFGDKKTKAIEKLFKAIYGELISNEYSDLSNEEVVDVAMRTIHQFADRQRIELRN